MRSIARSVARRIAGQRGQDTIEYIGALAIVAAVIGIALLIFPLFQGTLLRDAECLVEKIFGGRCTPPPAYPVSVSTKTVGYNGRVAFVNGAKGYSITLKKMSNGTSTITVVNTGSLGVSAQVGAGVELGPLGGADADASIGGGVYGNNTTTWTFPSWSKGQNAYSSISGGSSLGLVANDAANATIGQVPVAGPDLTKAFDWVTGASPAPSQGSLPKRYLTSTATGAGLQGSGDAKAGVNFGPLSAGVGIQLDANAGLQRINSGPQKGDYQLEFGLDGNADGSLTGVLFGSQQDIAGTVNGEISVTFSPTGAPQTLEVAATGDGVWDVGPPQNATVNIPGQSSGKETGGQQGGSENGGGEKEPLLSVDTQTSGGNGVGTSFVGELNLTNDPQAVTDLESVLEGDTSKIPALVNDMNQRGTEVVQTYKINRSNSTEGVQASAGLGFGAGLNDGNSSATYNPPEVREGGGPWRKQPF